MKRSTVIGCLAASIMLAIVVGAMVGVVLLLEHFFPPLPPRKGSLDPAPRDRVVPMLRIASWLVYAVGLAVATIGRGISRFRAFVEVRRWRRNQCIRCGYLMTGNISGSCPECGKQIRPLDERLFDLADGRPYSERMPIIFGGALLGLGAFLLLMGIVETEARIWGTLITAAGTALFLAGVAWG